ncbi:MAG: hypothetical protein IIT91_00865, partial [Aeriscardovia sp.]|nr:hypothetical protein [Aeriscardovia sp.]
RFILLVLIESRTLQQAVKVYFMCVKVRTIDTGKFCLAADDHPAMKILFPFPLGKVKALLCRSKKLIYFPFAVLKRTFQRESLIVRTFFETAASFFPAFFLQVI